MKVALQDTITEKQNMKVKSDMLDMEKLKLQKMLDKKEEEYSNIFNQRENLRLSLESQKDLYKHLEKKMGEYIKRIRDEHKNLRKQMEMQAERYNMEYEELYTRTADTCRLYQESMLKGIETQKGESVLNKKIHSIEWDVQVGVIKIRNMKEELIAAKNSSKIQENQLKDKKSQIEKLKQDLNKISHENEILKRVVYDNKGDISVENKKDGSLLGSNLNPHKNLSSHNLNSDFIASSMLANSSFQSVEAHDKVSIDIQTNSLKRHDRFTQTEKLGNSRLIVANISPQTTRKFNKKSSMGPNEEIYNLPRNASDKFLSDYTNIDNISRKDSSNKSFYKKDFMEITNVIDSESESISDSTPPKIDMRQHIDISKIKVSSLERVTTIKTNEFMKNNSNDSRILPSTSNKSERQSRNSNMFNVNSEPKMRAVTSRFMKKPTVEICQDIFALNDRKREDQLKVIDKFKRNLTSRGDKGYLSTLVSDKPMSKSSMEEGRNTMTAVYEEGKSKPSTTSIGIQSRGKAVISLFRFSKINVSWVDNQREAAYTKGAAEQIR